jgi:hypothetical protein
MTAEEVEAAGRGGCLKPVILLHSASIAVMSISYGFFGPVLGPEVRRALHGTPLLTGMLFAVGAVSPQNPPTLHRFLPRLPFTFFREGSEVVRMNEFVTRNCTDLQLSN